MGERRAVVERKTRETIIRVALCLDGEGKLETSGGVGFFNHLLDSLVKYALFDLDLHQEGDLHVDAHHLVEDVGICLGQALRQGLDDRRGIRRYGWSLIPMDEALVAASVDLCGRAHLSTDYRPVAQTIGGFDAELAMEFASSFCQHAGAVMHWCFLRGSNDHHALEAAFKALGWALRDAVSPDPRRQGRWFNPCSHRSGSTI